MEISVKELNELLEKEFQRGRDSVTIQQAPVLGGNSDIHCVPIACRSCPNHPSNGGSGICNCSLPDEIIY